MDKITMNISEGQFLSDTEEFKNGTPSNFIIFKRIPGLGATHGECLKYERHSIIIEPNVPVLEGKQDALDSEFRKIYPDIFVVYKSVKKDQIKAYLNSNIKFKKILCTPEAYENKVKKAINESSFNLYKDFFLLFDECDRLIKDPDYRKGILLPMKDFFMFKNKALISATAIEPSDERFMSENFKILEVMPDYDYRKDIHLIETNNILFALKEQFREKNGQFFIFINSASLIHVLIERLKIEDDSKIFCANKSVRNLKRNGFENATSKLKSFAKYNFLTSRNFTAVDIKLVEKPHVILVTDTLRKSFTMLDPLTDSTQIIGRFRNGVKSSTHISNFDDELEWKPRAEAIEFINDSYQFYVQIDVLRDLNSLTEGGTVTAQEAMEGTEIHNYVDEDLKLNKYMLDNYLLDQVIKSNYTSKEYLLEAYQETGNFNVTEDRLWYTETDGQLLILEKDKTSPEAIKIVADMLLRALSPIKPDELLFPDDTLVREMCPEIARIFDTLGYVEMDSLNFNLSKMNKKYNKLEQIHRFQNPEFIKEIQALFTIEDRPSKNEAKNKMQPIYIKYGILKPAKADDFKKYFFEASNSTNTGNIKSWNIIGYKNY
jgi:hypothetical protein